MIPEKMIDVLENEGVVAIVTQGKEAHVVNTWNSYIEITEEGDLLIPAGTMKTTEANVENNNKVLLTLGSRDVEGFNSMGTGFLIEGKAEFLGEGEEFDLMKGKFPWMRAVLKVETDKITQTL